MMRWIKIGGVFFGVLLLGFGSVFLYLVDRAGTSHGQQQQSQRFSVVRGEDLLTLGHRLEEERLIDSRWTLVAYLLRTGKYRSLQAGEYLLSGEQTVEMLVEDITSGNVIPPGIRVTIPEGWTLREMGERFSEKKLPGEDVVAIALNPYPKWKERFPFLLPLPAGASLEGYLFPDTYIFPEEATGELIVNELLENFGKKVTETMRTQTKAKGLSLHELITLASIVEVEVNTKEDRRMVADLFLRRLEIGQALQSDATLRYVLGVNKQKYSLEDTRAVSPYNTYRSVGLPPGPIGNPGLEALEAVLYPEPNEYYYFLNNTTTGKTVFAKTFEEHVKNKQQNGL